MSQKEFPCDFCAKVDCLGVKLLKKNMGFNFFEPLTP